MNALKASAKLTHTGVDANGLQIDHRGTLSESTCTSPENTTSGHVDVILFCVQMIEYF